jgi:hypothetical protein
MVYDDGSLDQERSVSIMAMKTIWWNRCCHCWLRYESIWDYKEEVQQRCTVQGISFVAWDATSFLLGLQMAGICVITLNNQQEGEKK